MTEPGMNSVLATALFLAVAWGSRRSLRPSNPTQLSVWRVVVTTDAVLRAYARGLLLSMVTHWEYLAYSVVWNNAETALNQISL